MLVPSVDDAMYAFRQTAYAIVHSADGTIYALISSTLPHLRRSWGCDNVWEVVFDMGDMIAVRDLTAGKTFIGDRGITVSSRQDMAELSGCSSPVDPPICYSSSSVSDVDDQEIPPKRNRPPGYVIDIRAPWAKSRCIPTVLPSF